MRETDVFVPGSILRLRVDPSQPLAFGLPEEVAAFVTSSAAFNAESGADTRVAARYAENGLLMSGWLLGGRILAGRAAALDVPLGRGRVVLLAIRAQHRGQPHGTFKFLFNSLLLNALQS
jgi:hypothetical protein